VRHQHHVTVAHLDVKVDRRQPGHVMLGTGVRPVQPEALLRGRDLVGPAIR
jgi:hypothetical protein